MIFITSFIQKILYFVVFKSDMIKIAKK